MLAQLRFGRFFLAAWKPWGVMGEEGARRVCVRRLQTPVRLAAPEPRDEPRAERPTQRFALLSPSVFHLLLWRAAGALAFAAGRAGTAAGKALRARVRARSRVPSCVRSFVHVLTFPHGLCTEVLLTSKGDVRSEFPFKKLVILKTCRRPETARLPPPHPSVRQ